MIKHDKLSAAIWGFITGDALGVPYEFCSREMMKKNPANDMVGHGTHDQPAGTWSDDTSMMLCVLENTLKGDSLKDLAKLFVDWYKEGYHTAHGEVFDIGITTQESLERLLAGGCKIVEAGSNDPHSAGNGSLMRSVPYAFYPDFAEGAFKMQMQSKITHRLPVCTNCCRYYIRFLRSLADGHDKATALNHAKGYLHFGLRIIDGAEDEPYPYAELVRLFDPNFKNTPEENIMSGGYVVDSLEAAIWCFLNTDDYASAVLKAVNLGRDTDTIAALTGALAGVYYGMESIPGEWLSRIARKTEIDKMMEEWMSYKKE
jgi:ADP-ribosylglycohydrolase